MAKDDMKIRAESDGVTVKVSLWSLKSYIDEFNAEAARLWLKGTVTSPSMPEALHFNDPGELLKILSKLNVEKFKQHKKAAAAAKKAKG